MRFPTKIILITLLLVLLVGFIWVLGTLLHDALPSNQPKKTVSSEDPFSYDRGPFTLQRFNEDVGSTLYTSFRVFSRTAKGGSELVYVCGRRFESLQVRSIGWASDGSYDIVVKMTDGTEHLFGFDNNSSWQ